ncbi:hypothetical protein LZT09_12730 [Vibrio fluvialis]|uniref:hypothetical protein n=1 Tax=Vibrio fluvialis TaxID=676 RepID=UPI001F31A825|nr:hypothetical protein [Vibrio fluvialis]MCE7615488.1 hypothetical protein [Vibrio fluvialis]
MEIPKLIADKENFTDYLLRVPAELKHVPEDIIRTWFWYHNEQAVEFSKFYDFTKWKFTAKAFTNDQILEIRHYDYYLKRLDDKGGEFLKGRMKGYDTADFMRANGTFPEPILVVENGSKHKHHHSIGDETMLEPYHIIEGQRRLGFIRAMIRAGHPKLQASHRAWVATIED